MKIPVPYDYDPRVTFRQKAPPGGNYYLYFYLPSGDRVIVSARTKLKTVARQRPHIA